ncbi:hypothetical protein [Campylobacter sp. CCUG 57310]|uniref:hypothetical protein n=1 Tax=Campylobacter sp. CCUG 57310 TaxID=2517362 RepID=UPI001563DD77|nr:hypothetical protein [Campylobacter sp. CCUG 57310]QKF93133.1 hypothetical protein CORI_1981 [Campylobacter sp. CCUG 57310]
MTLFTPKSNSKEEFNKLLIKRAGSIEDMSHQTLYNIAYEIYCSLVLMTDKKETIAVMTKALSDEINEIKEDNQDLKDDFETMQRIITELKQKNDNLQRIIRLHSIDKLSKEELLQEMIKICDDFYVKELKDDLSRV